MRENLSASHGVSMKGALIGTITLAGIIPLGIVGATWFLTDNATTINQPLHAFLETAGAAAAVGVSSLLWMRSLRRPTASHIVWVVAALVSMGVIDAVHASLPFGLPWSWTRHAATLVGGTLFACVWIPVNRRAWKWRRSIVIGVLALSGVLAVLLCVYAEHLPTPFAAGRYTMGPKVTNAIGGLGFFVATFFFVCRYRQERDWEHLTFVGLTLLFAISGLLFGVRGPWTAMWWMWHVFRFIAYAIVVFIGYGLVRSLHLELLEQKRTLERQVEQRTDALRLRTEALAASEQEFRGIFETANEGIWILDENARIQLVNPRLTEMFGYSEPELVGHLKWEFVSEEHQAHVRERFAARRQGIAEQYEVRFRRKDGTDLWALFAARPIFENGQFRGSLDMITDNTQRKRAELELARLRDDLQRHAENLEQRVQERTAELEHTIFQLESFSYSITHDMRAPLRAITGFAHEIAENHGAALSPEARRMLERIRKAALRLDALIRDVLNYSRLARNELPMQRTNLLRLVQDVIHDYPQFREHERNIHIECSDAHVYANPAALTQCISNLVGNALKFVAPDTVPQVRIWCEQRNVRTRLTIEDNGIGIAAPYQDRIFGVFQRLHTPEEYSGTGIGLAIVKTAVERMGGVVGVQSEPGKGSRFWLELPTA